MSAPSTPEAWAALRHATRTLLRPGALRSAELLEAVQVYRAHHIPLVLVRVCQELGYRPSQADYVLCLALAGLGDNEIATSFHAGTMPSRDTAETLIALRGRHAPPRRAARPRRRKPGTSDNAATRPTASAEARAVRQVGNVIEQEDGTADE